MQATEKKDPGELPATNSTTPEVPPESRARRLQAILTRAVARTCPKEHAALREDLVQTALLRVLEIERANETNTVRSSSYLWRVAYSVLVDELRRVRRREAVSTPMNDNGTLPQPTASTSDTELGLALRSCLGRLLEGRRLAVVLHLEGFQSDEAARLLGWDTKRVRNLIFRGMNDLRHCLRGKGYEP